jgi:hypothetical protein
MQVIDALPSVSPLGSPHTGGYVATSANAATESRRKILASLVSAGGLPPLDLHGGGSPRDCDSPELEEVTEDQAKDDTYASATATDELVEARVNAHTMQQAEFPMAVNDPRRKLIMSLNRVGLLSGEEERRRQQRDLKDYPDIAALAHVAKTKENFYEIMGSPKISPTSTSAGPDSSVSTGASPEFLPRTLGDVPAFDLNSGTDAEALGFTPFQRQASWPAGIRTPPPEQELPRCVDQERSDLLWKLAGNGSPQLKLLETPEVEPDGSCTTKSGVYLLSSPKIGPSGDPFQPFQSIFKPLDEEVFERRGIEIGMGALREEAAFVIDRASGGQAHVPVTARASLADGCVKKKGSVQQFVEGSVGPVENYGMPHELQDAVEFVGLDNAQAVACLDIRIFNTDRHAANLLLAGPRPHKIVCIDHGCVLPAWWALDSSRFDAWLDWPHVKAPPSPATLSLIRQVGSTLPLVLQELEKLGVPKQALWTLEICTTLLQKCVLDHGLTLRSVALLMTRSDIAQPCWLERKVADACNAAGATAEFKPEGKYGDLMLQVDQKIVKGFTLPEGAAFDNKHLANFCDAFFIFLNGAFADKEDVIRAAQDAEDATRPPWE